MRSNRKSHAFAAATALALIAASVFALTPLQLTEDFKLTPSDPTASKQFGS